MKLKWVLGWLEEEEEEEEEEVACPVCEEGGSACFNGLAWVGEEGRRTLSSSSSFPLLRQLSLSLSLSRAGGHRRQTSDGVLASM